MLSLSDDVALNSPSPISPASFLLLNSPKLSAHRPLPSHMRSPYIFACVDCCFVYNIYLTEKRKDAEGGGGEERSVGQQINTSAGEGAAAGAAEGAAANGSAAATSGRGTVVSIIGVGIDG